MSQNSKVPIEASQASYRMGLKVYNNQIAATEASRSIAKKYRFSVATAKYNVDALSRMLRGQLYKRSITTYTTNYYLDQIHSDGQHSLRLPLQALKKHIEYFAKRGNRKPSLRAILKKFSALINQEIEYADELKGISKSKYIEGAKKEVIVNAYERDSAARAKCLDIHGYQCSVCNFDFLKEYGEIGRNYIHVHHITDLSSIGKEYEVDPQNDLIPVCPNCHSMLHRDAKPARTVEELKSIIQILRDN